MTHNTFFKELEFSKFEMPLFEYSRALLVHMTQSLQTCTKICDVNLAPCENVHDIRASHASQFASL